MGVKSVINKIIYKNSQGNREFRHRSVLMIIGYNSDRYLEYTFRHKDSLIQKRSDSIFSQTDFNNIKAIVDQISKDLETLTVDKVVEIQDLMSVITENFLPKAIIDFLLKNKNSISYIAIDDDDLPFDIPFNLFFIPDYNEQGEYITNYGFFLGEKFTISKLTEDSDMAQLQIRNIGIISSEDLPGSIREEIDIKQTFNGRQNVNIVSLSSNDEIKRFIQQSNPECLHFCCHGNPRQEIIYNKNNSYIYFTMDELNLIRFKTGAFIFLNICYSGYSKYDNGAIRSIARKFLSKNSKLVISSEWPINDNFGGNIGLNFYKSICRDRIAIQVIHELKNNANGLQEKICAVAYTLRGDPKITLLF